MSQVKILTYTTYCTFVALNDILKYVKRSLRKRCENALSTDWLTGDKTHTFPLREYFVGLKQRKKIKWALKDTFQKLERVHDILEIEVKDGGAINIALIG